MPAAAWVVSEETPGVAVVRILQQHSHTVDAVRVGVLVFLPDDGEEERAGRVHDGDVREHPGAVVCLQ